MINSWLAVVERTVRPQHSLGVAPRPLLPILMLGLSLSFGAGQARAQCGSLGAPSTMWQNAGNSFWDLSGNWTSGTPTASTNACVLNGTSTVELNTNANANGLQLAAGNSLNIDSGASLTLGTGKSLIFGTLFNDSGTITNSGKLTNGGSIVNIGGVPGVAVLNNNSGAHLINNGSIGLSFSTLSNNSGASLTNNGTISGADFATLANSGTFINKSAISLLTDSLRFSSTALGLLFCQLPAQSRETAWARVLSNQGTFLITNKARSLSRRDSTPAMSLTPAPSTTRARSA